MYEGRVAIPSPISCKCSHDPHHKEKAGKECKKQTQIDNDNDLL